MNKSYQLRYLPLFEDDLIDITNYISKVLNNTEAALKLVDDVEKAIIKRKDNPLSFEPYLSSKKRENTYYRIYVRNYVIFYVVIDDVMEVRRIIYSKRDRESLL